jgi:hypothetical protein
VDFDMVEPTVVEPKNHPPINPNDSGVEDRYPKRSRISKLQMCTLFVNCIFENDL